MKHHHFIQSNPRLRNLQFTGELISQCEVRFEELPYVASLYRVNSEKASYVGVMEVKALKQLEADYFSEVATDEMEMFFGPEASFMLFKAAQMEGYRFLGEAVSNEANQ
ncbi:hypothetical protein TUM4438_10370 [Shewanella sairae]|uniref:Uncharacterized protein n=1 Tax=Shewanella sairae TaxID=190310 RepID=A0ABQ4P6U1_9GAMM|nr:hypothetical protein [Shewanella sairae]MCL1130471.1 hypothetical protein [Shewanella sairae]GIU42851.1 hypothetical protein TUM4438_10370 [Shewanella sairae]